MNSDELKKIEGIYQAALKLSADARSAFLEKTCGEDPELRKEVESLLSFDQTSDSLIKKTPEELAADMFSDVEDTDFSGKEVGSYKVLSKIGQGGMGTVYLAKDKTLSRQVAIKFLNREFIADKNRLKRFILEAKTASALNHPNIITIYEVGKFDGNHFIATEYIEGETLREKLKDKSLNQSDVLKFAIQITSALEAAHKAGIIHRDIKPDNVMVRPDGLSKVLDFGIAKLSARKDDFNDEGVVKTMTREGMIIGTANYMSPEQARGHEVDFRTDIFSFGIVCYFMLAGKLPFEGETPSDIIAAILKEAPQDLDKFDEHFSPELKDIVEKCLAKEADERFQTASDLLNELKSFRKKLEVSEELEKSVSSNEYESPQTETTNFITRDNPKAPTDEDLKQVTTAETSGSFVENRKSVSPAFFGVLGILLVAVIGLGYFYLTKSTSQIESVAIMPFINENPLDDIEYLTDGLTESLINSVSQIPNLSVKSRSTVFRYKGKEFSPKKIAEELKVQAILVGRITKSGEETRLNLELIEVKKENVLWGESYKFEEENLLSLQRTIAKNLSSELRPNLLERDEEKLVRRYTANADAYEAYLKGRFYWSKREGDNLKKAIEYFEKAIEIDPGFALAWSGLADSYSLASFYLGMPEREAMFKAKSAAKKAIELDSELAEAYVSLATILDEFEWKFEDAEKNLDKAIELNPKYTTAYQWKTILLGKLGKYDEAIESAKKAIELEPLALMANYRLASIYFFAERYDEASEQLEKTAELHPNVFIVRNLRAKLLRERGKPNEAEKILLEIIEEDGRKPHYLRVLATIYAKAGKDRQTRELLQEVLKLKKEGKGEYWNVAEIYARLGEKEKAFEYLNKSFQERESSVLYTKRDINLKSLRNTQRFNEFLIKLGLER